MSFLSALFGVESEPSKHLGGRNMTATQRKPALRKPVRSTKQPTLTAKQKAYLATLSPKLRKVHLLLLPLRGKLTKAIEMK
ncbi:MAG: hypothetical protein HY936_01805 [Nitrosomonadales bacterium]|nr:hypothetical protein [Nitrosomonadales bacterium]